MNHEHHIVASRTNGSSVGLPVPRARAGGEGGAAISVRAGTLGDLPFIDSLQKQHTKQVGWFPTKTIEGKINAGHVLVAVAATPASPSLVGVGGDAGVAATEERVGYCIGNDQYFKHDDIGIIYQVNVAPGRQRGLVGAMLVKAMFDRAAWGCKLFCCWCAQDIEANRFWESLGFVPLAFRTGSAKKSRVHIFWQRRIRAGDETTPYWFPSQTSSGSIREDRLVLPIPPGTHWSDAKPLVLPGEQRSEVSGQQSGLPCLTSDVRPVTASRKRREKKVEVAVPQGGPCQIGMSRMSFGAGKVVDQTADAAKVENKREAKVEKKTEKKPKAKFDPKLVAAARELRDRWMEEVNGPGGASLLAGCGKYDVGRQIEGAEVISTKTARLLTAA